MLELDSTEEYPFWQRTESVAAPSIRHTRISKIFPVSPGKYGFEVDLVNVRRTKNLPGRKSDVQDPNQEAKCDSVSPTHVQSNFAEQRLSYHDVDVNAGEVQPAVTCCSPLLRSKCGDAPITVLLDIRYAAEVRAAWSTALRQAANTLIEAAATRVLSTAVCAPSCGLQRPSLRLAHPLARPVYRMQVDKGTEYYEERIRQQQIHLVRKRAAKLGLQLDSGLMKFFGEVENAGDKESASRALPLSSAAKSGTLHYHLCPITTRILCPHNNPYLAEFVTSYAGAGTHFASQKNAILGVI